MAVIVPPIKSQGIKTKLVPWINDLIAQSGLDLANTNWIEPFFGTGVVGLNAPVGGDRYVADSGYGQGQVLVNPLHMACIYSAFCNEGNVIKPYLVYQKDAVAEYWIPGAFSNETASRVLEGTKKVVNDSNGTGYAAHRDDILLAGKTGTAEIKASKDDTSGTELGWFAIFTAEDTVERPILIISMVEDVKGRGGSGYVVKKDNLVLEEWFGSN